MKFAVVVAPLMIFTAGCRLSIRPLPFEEWARGAATVSIKALVAS